MEYPEAFVEAYGTVRVKERISGLQIRCLASVYVRDHVFFRGMIIPAKHRAWFSVCSTYRE